MAKRGPVVTAQVTDWPGTRDHPALHPDLGPWLNMVTIFLWHHRLRSDPPRQLYLSKDLIAAIGIFIDAYPWSVAASAGEAVLLSAGPADSSPDNPRQFFWTGPRGSTNHLLAEAHGLLVPDDYRPPPAGAQRAGGSWPMLTARPKIRAGCGLPAGSNQASVGGRANR